eukprot:2545030-Pleurochrysis_carterae.AAC.1
MSPPSSLPRVPLSVKPLAVLRTRLELLHPEASVLPRALCCSPRGISLAPSLSATAPLSPSFTLSLSHALTLALAHSLP